MTDIPLDLALLAAAVLFAIGVAGVVARRNLLFVLMSVEVLLNAAGLAFVAAGSARGVLDGQVMALFVIVMAAAEVTVGLGLVLAIVRRDRTLDADAQARMKG